MVPAPGATGGPRRQRPPHVPARRRAERAAPERRGVRPSGRQGADLAAAAGSVAAAAGARGLRCGAASVHFPAPWSVYGWLDGEPASSVDLRHPVRLAEDLAAFLVALRSVDPTGDPVTPAPHKVPDRTASEEESAQ
ncbi:phosphotransferase [uncultured Cellulomonas sp.]|uniref:phosphotransferase n=1 Tax=uncultured Cellulomonas sp. TaxID=189682 RepID=UPI00345B79D2